MKGYVDRSVDSRIRDFDTRWMPAVSFTLTSRFTARENPFVIHWLAGWMGPWAFRRKGKSLIAAGNRSIFLSYHAEWAVLVKEKFLARRYLSVHLCLLALELSFVLYCLGWFQNMQGLSVGCMCHVIR